jgi:hypothetical protein
MLLPLLTSASIVNTKALQKQPICQLFPFTNNHYAHFHFLRRASFIKALFALNKFTFEN